MDGGGWVEDRTGPPTREPCPQCGAGPVRAVQYREKFTIGSFRYGVRCEQCGWQQDVDADQAAGLFAGRSGRAAASTSGAAPGGGSGAAGARPAVAVATLVALAVAGAVMFALLSAGTGGGPSVVGPAPEPLPAPPPPLPEAVNAEDVGAAVDDAPPFDPDLLLSEFTVGPGGTLSAFDAPVGACFQRASLRAGAVGPADLVGCGEPHDYQVFAAGQPEAWPGARGVDAGWVFCWEAFQRLLGADAPSHYLSWPVVPTTERWADGARDVSCILESALLQPLTESALPR